MSISQIVFSLLVASVPAVIAVYLFFVRDQKPVGLMLLIISAFLLRAVMAVMDPYLHEWDEHFHALVAKNMMAEPFRPTLFKNPVLPYTISDWSYNHVWVHKQPLFLWQMALSMKIFGVNTFAVRLPSVILGTLMVPVVYDLGRRWMKNDQIGFIGAIITCFSYYILQLTSGIMSLEHNDLVFACYVTATIWAVTRYAHSDKPFQWILLIGIFSGLAILNKWLVGLLPLGGWAVYFLLQGKNDWKKHLRHFAMGLGICILVFLPWQLYILMAFPEEAAVSFEHNRKHMTSDLGHPGDHWTHIRFLTTSYGWPLLVLMMVGFIRLIWTKEIFRPLYIAALAMIGVIFAFFSFFVATKMPALVFPVCSLLFMLAAYGFYFIVHHIGVMTKWPAKGTHILMAACTLPLFIFALKPKEIQSLRQPDNQYRITRIQNASVYQGIPSHWLENKIVLNCRSYDNMDLMFYKNVTAYHWYPEEHTMDSLQRHGHTFIALEYADGTQGLPWHILSDSTIQKLKIDAR